MKAVKFFAALAVVFGIMTVISGSIVLFINGPGQKSAGNYVAFVVWFNLISGIGYIISGFGLWRLKKWAVFFSGAIAFGILVTLFAFANHVIQDGLFEVRTLYALIFRLLVWGTISAVSYRKLITKT